MLEVLSQQILAQTFLCNGYCIQAIEERADKSTLVFQEEACKDIVVLFTEIDAVDDTYSPFWLNSGSGAQTGNALYRTGYV